MWALRITESWPVNSPTMELAINAASLGSVLDTVTSTRRVMRRSEVVTIPSKRLTRASLSGGGFSVGSTKAGFLSSRLTSITQASSGRLWSYWTMVLTDASVASSSAITSSISMTVCGADSIWTTALAW